MLWFPMTLIHMMISRDDEWFFYDVMGGGCVLEMEVSVSVCLIIEAFLNLCRALLKEKSGLVLWLTPLFTFSGFLFA